MSVNCAPASTSVRPTVLVVSSDLNFAGVLERHLRADFEVHAAESDDLAFALLDANPYACVIVDLRTGASTVRLNALTVPTVVLIPAGAETIVPENAHAYINDGKDVGELADAIREVCREESGPQS
jgi:ActR/RegA family two-component response regulator